MTATTIATDLPDIVHSLGDYLQKRELKTAIRVSKLWYDILVPFLYRNVSEMEEHSLCSRKTVVLRHSSHIRRLSVFISNRNIICERLEQLTAILGFKNCKNWTIGTICFLTNNSSLLRLCIQSSVKFRVDDLAWCSMFRACPRTLQELTLEHASLSDEHLQSLFLELGEQLVKLKMVCCEFSWMESHTFPKNPQFPRLKSLSLDNIRSRFNVLNWACQCPLLDSLTWDNIALVDEPSPAERYVKEFCRLVVPTCPIWSQLHQLTLNAPSYPSLCDSQMALILDACALLTRIFVPSTPIWYRCLTALERHYPTLKYVDIAGCEGIRSWMQQRILTSCPKLIYFRADPMHANELVDTPEGRNSRVFQINLDAESDQERQLWEVEEKLESKELEPEIRKPFEDYRAIENVTPWACLGLEYLIMGMDELEDGWDEHVCRQLSRLTKLKTLNVGLDSIIGLTERRSETKKKSENRGLELRLRSGLGLLKPIECLEVFGFEGTRQEMMESDLAWILNQWPSLERLSKYSLHSDEEKRKALWTLVPQLETTERRWVNEKYPV
ncbi:hypothetical protein BGZ83_005486 [Gryganskiella cystojenkinii]|nr:hypothetical protein BGZ83_005486 [Gryganskiella cystojenkinii]